MVVVVVGAEGTGDDLRGLGLGAWVEGAGSGVAQALLELQGSVVKKAEWGGFWWAGWGAGGGAERLKTEVR